MTRSIQVFLAGCTALVIVSVAYVWQLPTSKPQAPALNDALQVSQSGMPMRLYSGAVDAKSGQPLEVKDQSYDLVQNGHVVASFLLRKDKTTRDTFFQDAGDGLSFVREYYPLRSSDDARRIKGLVTYAADGKTMRSEIWWSANGTRERVGHLLDVTTGRYEEMLLFPDSNAAQWSKITDPNPYANNFERKLIIEKRWSGNAKHSLIYFDQLADDGTRDITTYDDNEIPMMAKHIGRWGKTGTTVKFFFPGIAKVRLESVTNVSSTIVTSYRLDGTVLYKQQLTSYSTSTMYFDDTGTKPAFEQARWKNNVVENGKPVENWPLWKITEFDGVRATREFAWRNGKLDTETLFNVTVDGVLWEKVIRTYREADGTLQRVDMLGRKGGKRTVEYTVAQNIRANVPAAEMVRQEEHEEIPIPEPQSGPGEH